MKSVPCLLLLLLPLFANAGNIDNIIVNDWIMYQPGNRWVFENERYSWDTEEVSIGATAIPLASGDAYPVYYSEIDGVEYYSVHNGVQVPRISVTEYITGHGNVNYYVEMSPPIHLSNTTYRPGESIASTGTATYVFSSLGRSYPLSYTSSTEFLEFEEVDTALGRFLSAKISIRFAISGTIEGVPVSLSQQTISWFVEGLGSVKKWDNLDDEIMVIRETSIPQGSYDTDGDGFGNNIELLNSAPMMSSQVVSMDEGGVYTGTLSASDFDGDELSYSIQSAATDGTTILDASTDSFTYTPDSGFNGTDSFTVLVSDTSGGSDIATLTVRVREVNEPPVASDRSFSIEEDVAIVGALSVMDEDAGDTHTFEVATPPQHGTISLNGYHFSYLPHQDYNGADTFDYRVTDSAGDSDTATINIEVTAVNDTPFAVSKWVESDGTSIQSTLQGYDADGDQLIYEIITPPGKGTVQLLDTEIGSFLYDPASKAACSDQFSYRVSDGQGEYSSSVAVTIQLPAPEEIISDHGTVELCTGWNLFSTPIEDETEISQLFGNTLEIIYPNSHPTIDPLKGYWVKLNRDVTLNFSGVETTIWNDLTEGLNLVGSSIQQTPLELATAIEIESGFIVTRIYQFGNRSHWKLMDFERDIGSLISIHPHLGYLVELQTAAPDTN